MIFFRIKACKNSERGRQTDRFVNADVNPVIGVQSSSMTDPNEISALKASYRGAIQTGRALSDLSARIDAIDPHQDIPSSDLDDLARLTAAHAIASAALRGLVSTILARRGMSAPAES